MRFPDLNGRGVLDEFLADGNVADAARIADRNRTEFYRLLQKYDLTPSLFRGNGEDPKA